jgi:hypothetical protein
MRNLQDAHKQEVEELKAAITRFRDTMPGKRFTSEIRHRALKLVDAGMSPGTLARAIGVNKNAVYAWQDHATRTRSFAAVMSRDMSPRVLRVNDDGQRKNDAPVGAQSLHLQVGAFDVTVALRMGQR